MLTGILPSWVEPDPLRSLAIDPLGLAVVGDRLADRVIPGLSVLTTRARYFTFLCWARQRTGSGEERAIHRLEVALALTEHRLSEKDPDGHRDCSFVGKNNIKTFLAVRSEADALTADPRNIYKNPVWGAYRASMVQLGLLTDSREYALDEAGEEASRAFRRVVGSAPARKRLPDRVCLSLVSESRCEKGILRDALGLSMRGPLDDESHDPRTRRAAFARLVKNLFGADGWPSPTDVLLQFERKRSHSLPEPQNTLRAAAVWEYLSLGLNLVFVAWVRAVDAGTFRSFWRAFCRSLSGRRKPPVLSGVSLDENDFVSATSIAVACLARAVALREQLPEQSSCLLDASPFELARNLVNRRNHAKSRAHNVLVELLERHRRAKGDEAWLEGTDIDRLDRLTINRQTKKRSWQPPSKVTVHGYRLPAFNQIAFDLGGF